LLIPDRKQQTISVSAMITCALEGRYVLRTQGFPKGGAPAPVREMAISLLKDEVRSVQFSFQMPDTPLTSGLSCDQSAVKIQLFAHRENARSDGMLSDSATLMCGYAPKTPDAYVPLNRAAAFAEPAKTVEALKTLHIPAVSLDAPAPDALYRALSRAGIAARQYMPADHPLRDAIARFPCVCLSGTPVPNASVSLEASAWQLCSMASAPRTLDDTLSAKELLHEAAGLPLDPKDAGVHDALLWLRALSVRLRAEAARQQRYHGALCAADEWRIPDISEALKAAFAPLHLSALPLCGAWWTGTRFSATLEAFIPDGAYEGGLLAQAVLEDSEGVELARFHAPCRPVGGYVGVIEAALPDRPCVLELTTRLLSGSEVVEESTMPVYVGERGQLEAAFG